MWSSQGIYMKMVKIRHRIEDVEKALVFTPASHESVLDLGPYVVKSFNALQAAIVINQFAAY